MEENKKTYLTPILQFKLFEFEDIVTASNGDELIDDGTIKDLIFSA